MFRLSIITALLLTLFIQMKGLALVWKRVTLSEEPREVLEDQAIQVPTRKRVAFYPSVPVTLPDLNDGYLFNEMRLLEEEETEELETDALEAGVDVENVLYVGSIITDTLRKAMLSVESPRKPVMNSRSRAGRKTALKKETNYITVSLGDPFHGYKVTGIFPEKIVFEKDGKVLEKFLFDPAKKRLTPPPIISSPTKTKAAAAAGRNVRNSTPAPSTVREQRAAQDARQRGISRPGSSRRPPPLPAVSPDGLGGMMPPEL